MADTALPPEMFEHYRQVEESKRLSDGVGELERLRTQDILSRHLPGPPATVFDVGGGAGVHALWLAQCGYTVHLFDPVPHHIEQALAASANQALHPIASCSVGDARSIDRSDDSADAVLLLGPLYHLIDRGERLKALQEACRVLKPGGRIFAATVSRFASLIDGLSRDLVSDPSFVDILTQDLRSGQHRNPTGTPEYFTTTFFHHPDELRQEMQEAGFQLEKLVGVEGPAWFMSSLPNHWRAPEKRRLLLELLRTVEQEPYLLGASAHPMGIGRKPALIAGRAE
jgi:ubiquinone/menaquinone biosynthesis C-methylase UbiE